MSKNTTRKGLAFGAGLALVASGFVSLPANASGIDNGFVSLVPTSGTAFRVLADGTFDLKSNVITSLAVDGKDLKFYVTDPGKVMKVDLDVDALNAPTQVAVFTSATKVANTGVVTVTSVAHGLAVGDSVEVTTAATAGAAAGFYRVTSVADADTYTFVADTVALTAGPLAIQKADNADLDKRGLIVAGDLGSAALIGATASIAASIGGTATTAGRLANGDFVVDTETHLNSTDRVLRLVNTDATKTATATVTAWVDDNNNGVIDATEYRSPAVTVSFHVNADLTVVSTIDTPVLGASGAGAVTGTVTVTPELNGQQVGNTAVTAAVTSQDAGVTTVTSTYSATSKLWNISGDRATIVVGNYSLRASVAGSAIGNTANAFVSTRVAADTEMSTAGTVDQQQSFNDTAGTPTTGVKVRKDKAVTVVVDAYTSTGAAVPAGRSVTVVFSAATQTTSWTVNGTVVLAASNGGTVTRTYTTDASGKVTLVISSGSGLGAIAVEARPEGLTTTAAAKTDFVWEAATYSIVDTNAPVASNTREISTGGSYTYNMFAKDQWNAPLTGAYRVQLTTTGRTVFGGNVELVNGRASATITDAGLGGTTSIVLTTQLQKQTAGVWANSTDATAFPQSTINVAAASTAALIPVVVNTPTAADAATLSPKAIQVYDVNGSQSNLVNPRGANVAVIQLNMAGIAVGDTVTVSGTDLFFAYAAGTAANSTISSIASGSLTFVVAATTDSIQVVSNKALTKAVVTFTHEGRTGTAEVSFTAALSDSVKNVDIAAPASASPGSTFQVTATLTDAFGNPVAIAAGDASGVSVTYTGPGIVFGSLPTTTDKSGKLSFAVLLGSNDSGTAAVSVSYNKVKATAVAANIITKQASVVVGANAGAVSTWTSKIDADSAKIYAKNIVGAGKVQFFLNGKEIAWVRATSAADSKLRTANGASYLVRTVEFAAGKNVLEVYVDGVRTTRTAYTK